jgi:hypothetical protein
MSATPLPLDPEAVDVEAPQEWRKRHNHDCAKTSEVTHGIIDKNVDLEASALGLQVLGLILLSATWPLIPAKTFGAVLSARAIVKGVYL